VAKQADPNEDRGTAYVEGYWDADVLLSLRSPRGYGLSVPMLAVLARMAGEANGSYDYAGGFRQRLAEHDDEITEEAENGKPT
jgi:hypothetical protein